MKRVLILLSTLLAALSFVLVIDSTPVQSIEQIDTIQTFLQQFYKLAEDGNEKSVREMFFHITEYRLKYLIATRPIYKLKRFDIVRLTEISNQPLTVFVEVTEWYEKGGTSTENDDFIFILEKHSNEKYQWKIRELTKPGLP